MKSKKLFGNLVLLLTALIWGCAFVAQSSGMDYVGPFTFQTSRSILGCLVLIPFIFANDAVKKKNNTYEKQKKKVGIALIIIMSLLEVKTLNITDMNVYYAFKQIASVFLPVLSKNILFTYLAYCKNYVAAVCYDLLIYLVLWLSPILPKMTWFMIAIIDIATPIILLLYIRYIKRKKDYFKSKEGASDSEPKSVIVLVIIVILAIWFALGIFPIKPIAIAIVNGIVVNATIPSIAYNKSFQKDHFVSPATL